MKPVHAEYVKRLLFSDSIIEGFYITLRDSSIWVVKGCCHERDRVVAVPRIFHNRKIKRFYDSLDIAKRYYSHYVRETSFTLAPVPMIPLSDVAEIISPSEKPCPNTPERLYRDAVELIEILLERGLKPLVSGSMLYCRAEEDSDIDLVFYDHDRESVRVLEKLLSERDLFSKLSTEDIERIISRVGDKPDPHTHKTLLTRSIHEFKFKNRFVSLRFINCDSETRRVLCSKIASVKPFSGRLEIVEDVRGYTTPSIYTARELGSGIVLTLYSHRIRYASLRRGDRLVCRGFIEISEYGVEKINLDLSDCAILV